MKFELSNVIPIPVKELEQDQTSIWRSAAVEINSPGYYLVKAASGKGKSSLVSFLYGIRKDYEGDILVDEKNISSFSPSDWAELRSNQLSFIPQDMRLFDKATVWENLMIKNKLTDYCSEKEMEDMLDRFGILSKKQQLCQHLSLGQQQRVAIIRSLLQPFEFLMMDEPFSHIDDNNIQIACDLIRSAAQKNKAGIILTTLGSEYYFDYTKTLMI